MRFIARTSEAYPSLLREIYDPPRGLYLLGDLPDVLVPTIAIVGTRKGTPEGRELARKFAKELAVAGFIIVSGLAFGVDTAAHEGCLEGGGKTVAVLANGLDHFYPRSNERLAKRILEHGGAVVSEYAPGMPALPHQFLERNRIISGLSRGILVVEAPEHSGSLATARFALEQNRDVFVVPGPISHPNYKGSNQLIRQGAELVTDPREIFEAYGIAEEEKIQRAAFSASPEEKLILSALRSAARPLEIDKIIEMTTLEPQTANRAITLLLLRNVIEESGSGYTIV